MLLFWASFEGIKKCLIMGDFVVDNARDVNSNSDIIGFMETVALFQCSSNFLNIISVQCCRAEMFCNSISGMTVKSKSS